MNYSLNTKFRRFLKRTKKVRNTIRIFILKVITTLSVIFLLMCASIDPEYTILSTKDKFVIGFVAGMCVLWIFLIILANGEYWMKEERKRNDWM